MAPLPCGEIKVKPQKRKAGRPKKIIDKKTLERWYYIMDKSINETALALGLAPNTVQRLMREYKIKPKKMSWVRPEK